VCMHLALPSFLQQRQNFGDFEEYRKRECGSWPHTEFMERGQRGGRLAGICTFWKKDTSVLWASKQSQKRVVPQEPPERRLCVPPCLANGYLDQSSPPISLFECCPSRLLFQLTDGIFFVVRPSLSLAGVCLVPRVGDVFFFSRWSLCLGLKTNIGQIGHFLELHFACDVHPAP
jgi:hypothetical protein